MSPGVAPSSVSIAFNSRIATESEGNVARHGEAWNGSQLSTCGRPQYAAGVGECAIPRCNEHGAGLPTAAPPRSDRVPLSDYIFPSVSSASRTCASVMLVVFGYFWMTSR
jgi:hypothetical protein